VQGAWRGEKCQRLTNRNHILENLSPPPLVLLKRNT
jgi:hypothetical protein